MNRSIILISLNISKPFDNFHPFAYPSKNSVFFIKPWCRCQWNEELTAICVRTCISHGQYSRSSMFQISGNFIFKSWAINWLPPSSCSSWVSALHHEILDNAVEFDIVVIAPSWELQEIPAGLGGVLVVELHCDRTHGGLEGDLGSSFSCSCHCSSFPHHWVTNIIAGL